MSQIFSDPVIAAYAGVIGGAVIGAGIGIVISMRLGWL